MKNRIMQVVDLTIDFGDTRLLDRINLVINSGEQWAVVGGSGSGKTTLAEALTGNRHFKGDIYFIQRNGKTIKPLLVGQQHLFKNASNTTTLYYQQRFNSSDSADSLTVSEALKNYTDNRGWTGLLHLDDLLNKPLIQLSNGENKRLQLARALMTSPDFLILDNPFTGLDTDGRVILNSIIDSICHSGIHILLITSPGELPHVITHVAALEKGRITQAGTKVEFHREDPITLPPISFEYIQAPAYPDFQTAVIMENTTIRYGEKTILDNVNWRVEKGSAWSVTGHNGAGKSTLLSLITGDNPQAYAQNIYLFDKRRGTGESIWDIKRKIGYISPELHLYFDRSASCFDVIASGIFDTIGLFRRLTVQQQESVARWMELMNLWEDRNKALNRLSLGNQRMVLLARALVKNPPLLILDEPFQGLDDRQIAFSRQLINQLHETYGTTIIFVSHYDTELPECVNRFFRLKEGKMIE